MVAFLIYAFDAAAAAAAIFFLMPSVVMEPGRSIGCPKALSHINDASTPKARDTPKRTV